MAGIYFRMEKDECSLTGYFRLEGHVSVLGLITASLELWSFATSSRAASAWAGPS
ncbi:hypothetical protein H1235_10055 [Pseudoxanthomonas sp. NC8]|nr:hypothetical protein H1235_10055 [Pseudoxanthomonas sp. NC8]